MPSDTARRLHREHLARQQRLAAHPVHDPGIHMHNGQPVAVDPPTPFARLRLEPMHGSIGAWLKPVPFPWASSLAGGDWVVPSIPLDEILRVVCKYYKTNRMDILSIRRQAPVVHARHVAMYLAKLLTTLSYPQIAKHFGDRDHTTVLHGVRAIRGQIEHNGGVSREIVDLQGLLGTLVREPKNFYPECVSRLSEGAA